MTSTTGIHAHTAAAAWPQAQWPRIRRALAGPVTIVRSSLTASRAFEDAQTEAGRRQVIADFLESIR